MQPTPTPQQSKPVASPTILRWSDTQWQAVVERLQLSDREIEIVRGMFDDHKESAIAARLGISPHTVHTHVVRLYLKLGVRSRPELIMRVTAEHIGHNAPPT
jgi:DNA-binding CsgD family transcriptional regulator